MCSEQLSNIYWNACANKIPRQEITLKITWTLTHLSTTNMLHLAYHRIQINSPPFLIFQMIQNCHPPITLSFLATKVNTPWPHLHCMQLQSCQWQHSINISQNSVKAHITTNKCYVAILLNIGNGSPRLLKRGIFKQIFPVKSDHSTFFDWQLATIQ